MSDFVREEIWGLSVMSQTAGIAFNSCWGARSNGRMEARVKHYHPTGKVGRFSRRGIGAVAD